MPSTHNNYLYVPVTQARISSLRKTTHKYYRILNSFLSKALSSSFPIYQRFFQISALSVAVLSHMPINRKGITRNLACLRVNCELIDDNFEDPRIDDIHYLFSLFYSFFYSKQYPRKMAIFIMVPLNDLIVLSRSAPMSEWIIKTVYRKSSES